jgi:aldose 1-epimerase
MIIEKQLFGSTPEGSEVHRYTLKNHRGMEVDIITYGAIITALRIPDRQNVPGDVVLGFDTLEEYLGDHPYFGAMIGRVCNRVAGSRFELDGKVYSLTSNEGANQLHGGKKGFDRQVWNANSHRAPDEVSLSMTYESADGEEGYPGTLLAEVVYTLNDQNELIIGCRAGTDKPTHVNLTNHSYFNLNNCEGSIHGHQLMIDAERITELDQESIPTGRILPVESTPYDFRLATPVGERIGQVEPGYDINYVLAMESRELTRVAAVTDPHSGRSMEVLTTLPGIQLYTSNYVKGIRGKAGRVYEKHCALCLETQYFPDSPNQSTFPSTVLLPGKEYSAHTVYRFSW